MSEQSNDQVYNLRQVDLKQEYNTEENDIIRELYAPCLKASERYDRAVGYFRANIYRELGEDLLNFAIRGGKIRIVCSPDMPEEDEEAARKGYSLRGKRSTAELNCSLEYAIDVMSKDPRESDCLEMLRLLIEKCSLELFIAIRPGGISHRKLGAFYDRNGDFVVFSGSGNETRRAVSAIEDWVNDEDFDVFRSWGDDFEAGKARKKAEYLNRLFSGGTEKTKIRPLSEVEGELIARFRSYDTLEDCRQGARARSANCTKNIQPKGGMKPHIYQLDAIRAWESAGRIGMLSMATGTGKTYTALFAIKDILREGRVILIVVPSNVLFNQWYSVIRSIYPDVPILHAGANYDWKRDPLKRMYVQDLKLPRIVLSTIQTASSQDFIEYFKQAENPVLIADEAHRLGSKKHREILKIDFKERLGLSATPERLFDEDGNAALARAFGKEPVYNLPISEKVQIFEKSPEKVPIVGHFLSRYYYFFEKVSLTSAEMSDWNKLTNEIKKLVARARNSPDKPEDEGVLSERLRMLFIKRAKIAKKAENKIAIAGKIISQKYPYDGRWIVYCEDEAQLDAVASEISLKNPKTIVMKYHSKQPIKERERVLDYFVKNPSIIVSIKCLDEGIDIPYIDGALILASSTNPREYIQRRGRVLRKAKGKKLATIIDVIVDPQTSRDEKDLPISTIRSELARAWEFANHAENKEITHELWRICFDYGVDLKTDSELSIEDLEEEE